jgi:GNAT superfamily N-acetyltransferase
MSDDLTFYLDRRPEVEAIRALYAVSPLRRPIDDPDRIRRMYEGSNVVISAYQGERLVGLLRGWTDFVFDGYVCDLAVHPAFQKAGVGRRLLDLAHGLGEGIQWILLASSIAKDYYAHLGWQWVDAGWTLPRAPWYTGTMEDYTAQHAELAAKA